MAEPHHRPDILDSRRRRARFRAWHRGTREMDLILGRFADANMDALAEPDLTDFEALLEAPDTELFDWIAGGWPVAPAHDRPVFRAILRFYVSGRPS